MRGDLVSRPIGDVMLEAERLVKAGVKELLVISQDTSAYGVDLKYATGFWGGKPVKTRFDDLARALGALGVWVRLHYVYPYPARRQRDPADGRGQGAAVPRHPVPARQPARAASCMKRPAHAENTLERIHRWREICPDITLRSTFIVGFPGETEDGLRGAARLAATRRSSIASAASSTRRSRARPRTRCPIRCRTTSSRNARSASWNAPPTISARKARGQGRPDACACSSTRSTTTSRSRARAPMRRRSTASCASRGPASCRPATGRTSRSPRPTPTISPAKVCVSTQTSAGPRRCIRSRCDLGALSPCARRLGGGALLSRWWSWQPATSHGPVAGPVTSAPGPRSESWRSDPRARRHAALREGDYDVRGARIVLGDIRRAVLRNAAVPQATGRIRRVLDCADRRRLPTCGTTVSTPRTTTSRRCSRSRADLRGARRSTPAEQADLELLATDAMVLALYHLYGGKVDPVKLSTQWNYPARPHHGRRRGRSADRRASTPGRSARRSHAARPQHVWYQRGRERLREYRAHRGGRRLVADPGRPDAASPA